MGPLLFLITCYSRVARICFTNSYTVAYWFWNMMSNCLNAGIYMDTHLLRGLGYSDGCGFSGSVVNEQSMGMGLL